MAPLFSVVVLGVPARIVNTVLAAIRERYPDQAVGRGVGAKYYENRLALYPEAYRERALKAAADAVFGTSDRPVGFCRNAHKECAARGAQRKNCDQLGTASCGREKGNHFIVVYQEGSEIEEQFLLEGFYFSPYAIKIPREYYDISGDTAEYANQKISEALSYFQILDGNISGQSPSILLPPKNFGRKELRKLVRRAMIGQATPREIREFKSQFFKEQSFFEGRSKLAFQPTDVGTSHGGASVSEDVSIALSRYYRAGCCYREGFHWDVYRTNKADLAGNVEIGCRAKGKQHPHGTHANILVNDCIR
jgi:hypothetical protein